MRALETVVRALCLFWLATGLEMEQRAERRDLLCGILRAAEVECEDVDIACISSTLESTHWQHFVIRAKLDVASLRQFPRTYE